MFPKILDIFLVYPECELDLSQKLGQFLFLSGPTNIKFFVKICHCGVTHSRRNTEHVGSIPDTERYSGMDDHLKWRPSVTGCHFQWQVKEPQVR